MLTETMLLLIYDFILVKMIAPPGLPGNGRAGLSVPTHARNLEGGGNLHVTLTHPPSNPLGMSGAGAQQMVLTLESEVWIPALQGTSYSQGFSWESRFTLIEIQKTVEPSQSSCDE